jgi:hypothetical protein
VGGTVGAAPSGRRPRSTAVRAPETGLRVTCRQAICAPARGAPRPCSPPTGRRSRMRRPSHRDRERG